jgi:hypothetical protein
MGLHGLIALSLLDFGGITCSLHDVQEVNADRNVRFCHSVLPSDMQFETAGRTSMKYDVGEFNVNLLCHVNWNFYWIFLRRLYTMTYVRISPYFDESSSETKLYLTKVVQKNETRFLYAIELLF